MFRAPGPNWAVILAVLAFIPAPAVATDSGTVEASLNVYRANPAHMIRADIRAAMKRADVIRLQETYPPRARLAVRQVLSHRPAWRITRFGRALEVPILWNSREFRRAGPAGYRHMSGHGNRGPAISRWLTWQALEDRATGLTVTVANVHPLPRYCRPGASPWRRSEARKHWQGVAEWTREQMAARPRRPILLGGDFNCRLSETGRPWFPGVILAPLYRFDRSDSIDRLITSRTPGAPRGLRRWARPAYSDHNAQFRALRWRTVAR